VTDDGFIGFPPGMAPPPPDTDSGTVKHQRPAKPDVVFRPVVPGAPPPPPPPAAATAVPGAPPTTSAPPPAPAPPAPAAAAIWRLRVPGIADPVVVDPAVVLGRNPSAPADAPDALALPIHDPAKSVSKTHALVVLVDGQLAVRDLDSTNGVWLVVPGADPVRIAPGAATPVPAGADLELGEFVIRVELA